MPNEFVVIRDHFRPDSNLTDVMHLVAADPTAILGTAWYAKGARKWDDFMGRLQVHVRRLEAMNVN